MTDTGSPGTTPTRQAPAMNAHVRMAVRVRGIVQGVGFRPFVHGLAESLGLSGHVGNDASGVFLEIEGPRAAADRFLAALRQEPPPLAVVEEVAAAELEPSGTALGTGFRIVASPRGEPARTLVSADAATCAECLAELNDPDDRRYRYPFVNCTHCGPRFTIVRGVPYDRPLTSMAGFPMCADCAREYADPADRRFHAQPVCCPACGPRLRLREGGTSAAGDALAGAVRRLRAGAVVAVKGLGGFHLAVDGTSERAAAALRGRKRREGKPFAVMVADIASAHRLCVVDELAESLLRGRRRPIVLLPRRPEARIADAVAPGDRLLGLMLPYTPLHHLLLGDFGGPLVLTSGNIAEEPIVHRDEDAVKLLDGIADAVLTHDRAIEVRADDSVVRPFRGRERLVRRSRGYAPEPVPLPRRLERSVLACGAELKNTFCLARERQAFLSPHIGDLENHETMRSFTEGIAHFRRLFGIDPGIVAHDLHPEYLSTKYACDQRDVELVAVQHHHAHIASCLADNGEEGPVLGVAFDGTGYGPDHTIWGGEFLLADLGGYRRLAHLAAVPMPGGAAAVRQPWRMAASYLDAAYGEGYDHGMDVVRRHAEHWPAVVSLARSGLNSPLTSSAGRLFDAVAAILGAADENRYEGQAAIALERLADEGELGAYEAGLTPGPTHRDPVTVRGTDLVRACVQDLRRGVPAPVISARFHRGVAGAVTAVCELLRERTGVGTVALSGGVFQNTLLLENALRSLHMSGFRVLTHAAVPANDGGISLGQAVVAGALTTPG